MTARAHDGGSEAALGEQRRAGALPWNALEALATEEAQLVADGRLDGLAELYAQRDALLAALPRPLPAAAAGPLRRALSAQLATATLLRARRDEIGAELGRLRRGRTGVQGYARTFDVAR